MNRVRMLALALLSAAVLIGCTDQGTNNSNPVVPEGDPTWNDNVGPLLWTNCSGCHSDATRQSGFSIEHYAEVISDTTTSGNPPVVPGNPEASELYLRLTGDGFTKMPLLGSLSDSEIQLVYDWIEAGALESAPSN